MKISVITPTCDRPVGLALLEGFMCRQTVQPDQWIVADGGSTPATCTVEQIHIYDHRPPGADNFAHNLLNAINAASGEIVVIAEDDDWMGPTHIETLVQALESNPGALLAGDDQQRYYNIARRCWRLFDNIGASLCQTAMRREALPLFARIIGECMARKSYGIDTTLWRAVPREQWAITGKQTVLGIKGLPGQPGLGIGHRPGTGWTLDPEFAQLTKWIGADAWLYRGLLDR